MSGMGGIHPIQTNPRGAPFQHLPEKRSSVLPGDIFALSLIISGSPEASGELSLSKKADEEQQRRRLPRGFAVRELAGLPQLRPRLAPRPRSIPVSQGRSLHSRPSLEPNNKVTILETISRALLSFDAIKDPIQPGRTPQQAIPVAGQAQGDFAQRGKFSPVKPLQGP